MDPLPKGWDDWPDLHEVRCDNCDSKNAIARQDPVSKKTWYRCPDCGHEDRHSA
jgi:DNA-directed RNA polymerase subunit RPC12/RpoP